MIELPCEYAAILADCPEGSTFSYSIAALQMLRMMCKEMLSPKKETIIKHHFHLYIMESLFHTEAREVFLSIIFSIKFEYEIGIIGKVF